MSDTQTNVEKFVSALAAPFQVLEDAMQQMYSERGVNTAVGAQLTLIGKLVGIEREGITDDEIFRRRVRAAIATNKSDGLIEDMYTIGRLIVFDDDAVHEIDNQGIAAFVYKINGVTITDPAVVGSLLKFLRRGVAAGVRIILELQTATPAESFAFDDVLDPGSAPGLGWGDTLDVDTGGVLLSGM